MSNQMRTKPALKATCIVRGLSLVLFLVLFFSCSIVFRSSIQGTVIDREDWTDGSTTGVTDAKVFLYTDAEARNADYDAYADGDETSLPDGAGKAEYGYFQSTVTDANGAYDFTGFIWEKFFSEYGKTADRAEVHLLVYHPDYGLWKNPVPLYVVSDVTNQLPQITIEDLWNQGRLAGTVLDWKDDEALAGVTVNLYVAKSWTYDGETIASAVYPTTISTTATTDADGRWTADVNFRKMPLGADKGKAPVRVSYVLNNYRANDDLPGDTGLSNAGLVTSADLDRDGATAAEGDYEDAFVSTIAVYDLIEKEADLVTLATLKMQRWRFSASVRGRIKEGATYLDNMAIKLVTPDATEYSTYSESQTNGDIVTVGVFDLGTINWTISDVADPVIGEVLVTMTVEGTSTLDGEAIDLLPDAQRNLTLEVTVP